MGENNRKQYRTDREALEEICSVEFYRGGGPGGQHRNKRDTGVRIHHRPSGVTVTATERRSQAQNREIAFERLERRLRDLNKVRKRRVPTKLSRRKKAVRLKAKRARSGVKDLRKKPNETD